MTEAATSPLGSLTADLAFCFLPLDPTRKAVVVEGGDPPHIGAAARDCGTGVVVWVLGANRSSAPGAVWHAGARVLAVHTVGRHLPPGWEVAGLHAVPPSQLRASPKARLAGVVRAGAVVELAGVREGVRVLDAVALAAGATDAPRRIHFAAGGAIVGPVALGDGTDAVLRVGRAGTAADPARLAATLRLLAAAGVPRVPVPYAQGTTAGAAWLVESRLPGRRPRRLTPALSRQVAEVCGSFPAAGAPPTALAEDLAGIADRLPERASALSWLAEELDGASGAWPGVLRHGDLWSGNLLADNGRLSGVLDWDGAHPAAIPGTDLVHLVATDALMRRRVPFGRTFLERPWASHRFRRLTAPYWTALGVPPDASLLDLAGLGWWAAAVHGTLARFPAKAGDRRWLAANVDPVLHARCSGIRGGRS